MSPNGRRMPAARIGTPRDAHDPPVDDEAPIHGLIAEFATDAALVEAARRATAEGYRDVDAYAPFSVPGLSDALGFRRDRVAPLTLLGGLLGGVGIYALQWYTAVIDYPINSGGRPLHSWPAFIPATFECTILGAALAAFFAFLLLSGLPKLRHPIFNAAEFDLATRNRFFLCVEAADPRFDRPATRAFLQSLCPLSVSEVPL